MGLGNTKTGWGAGAKWLHWGLAFIIFFMLASGRIMESMPPVDLKFQIYEVHKTVGLAVLLLVALRVAFRLANKPPPTLPQPAWQRLAAGGSHLLLYALMIIVPLSGYALSSSSPYGHEVLGVTIPKLVPISDSTFELAVTIHWASTTALFALILLHFTASLKHHLIDRDATLERMMPGWQADAGDEPKSAPDTARMDDEEGAASN